LAQLLGQLQSRLFAPGELDCGGALEGDEREGKLRRKHDPHLYEGSAVIKLHPILVYMENRYSDRGIALPPPSTHTARASFSKFMSAIW
jgi:hypothetical protein